ncbi:MAG: dCTP deaminase [bacterium]|nr:dCTP deaminase [bacterium]
MILSDKKILEEINKGNIGIKPFDKENMGSNSYDVHLSKHLAQYIDKTLDAKKHNKIKHFQIPKEGFVLKPGKLYLASTEEYTETFKHVPFLEGKSSTGRLGIDIHATAGKGDVGFCGYWTMEISSSKPVRIYAGMPIGQLIYYVVEGKVNNPYNKKKSAKYSHQEHLPKESMMWKNFK